MQSYIEEQAENFKNLLRENPNLPDTAKDKIILWISALEGNTHSLMTLSMMNGLISKEDYEIFSQMKDVE